MPCHVNPGKIEGHTALNSLSFFLSCEKHRRCFSHSVTSETISQTLSGIKHNFLIATMASLFYQLKNRECSVRWKSNDLVISITKKRRNQDLGLTLMKEYSTSKPCFIVSHISNRTPFAKTRLAPDMEIVIINGVACSSLDSVHDADAILRSAKRAVTIVARPREEDNIVVPPADQSPNMRDNKIRWSSSSAHMWLEMINFVNQKSTGTVNMEHDFLEPPKAAEQELATPIMNNSNRSRKPAKVELNRRGSLQRVISEITLNPSQHPVPAMVEDIEIQWKTKEPQKTEQLFLPSILCALYPDYDDTEEVNSRAKSPNVPSKTRTSTPQNQEIDSSFEEFMILPPPPTLDNVFMMQGDCLPRLSKSDKQSSCPVLHAPNRQRSAQFIRKIHSLPFSSCM